jgi:superfamily I DNA/RNA helicase
VNYNAEQLQAQAATSHVLVSAGPGSGKTGGVIVPKAVAEIKNGGAVIAVTFTRAAAGELRERLHKILTTENERGRIIVGTFHSIIAYQFKRANYRINIVDAAEQERMLNAALGEVGIFDTRKRDDIKMAVEAAKRSISIPLIPDEETSSVYNLYQSRLEAMNKLDLNDLIITAVRQMRADPPTIQPLNASLMLVDEFHDCDDPQLQWVLEHARSGVTVCAVADDDQAIYGFRASLGYRAVTTFVQELSAQKVTLKTNYRSNKEILDVASKLILYNQERVSKPMYSAKGLGGSVTVLCSQNRSAECNDIATTIAACAKLAPDDEVLTVPKSSWMVIARNNSYLDALSLTLSQKNIRVANVDFSRIWKRRPLNILVGLLMAAEGNGAAFNDCLKPAGIDVIALEALYAASADDPYKWITSGGASLPKTIDAGSASGTILVELISLLPRWVALAATAKASANEAKMGGARRASSRVEQAIVSISAAINPMIADLDEDKRASTLATLEVGVSIILAQKGTSITERVDRAIAAGKKNKGEDGVYLYTMHGSKGLEADNVWLMTCDASVIPGEGAVLEEERRLFYVAVTRARTNLIISYAARGNGIKRPRAYHPTGFLTEMGLSPLAAELELASLVSETLLAAAVFSNSGMSLKRGDLGGWGVRVDRVEKREV